MTTDDDSRFELSSDDGTAEPRETFEDDVAALFDAVRALLKTLPPSFAQAQYDVEVAVAFVQGWYEDDDPRSMGWVDDKGRP